MALSHSWAAVVAADEPAEAANDTGDEDAQGGCRVPRKQKPRSRCLGD